MGAILGQRNAMTMLRDSAPARELVNLKSLDQTIIDDKHGQNVSASQISK